MLSAPEDFRIIKSQPKSKQLVLKLLQVVRRIKAQKNQVGQLCEVKRLIWKATWQSSLHVDSAAQRRNSLGVRNLADLVRERASPLLFAGGEQDHPRLVQKLHAKKRIYCASTDQSKCSHRFRRFQWLGQASGKYPGKSFPPVCIVMAAWRGSCSEKYFWLSNGTRQRHHTNLKSDQDPRSLLCRPSCQRCTWSLRWRRPRVGG